MVRSIKNRLYFLVAWYFRLFAAIRLARWKPRIVVITGSNGKTTALHLVEAQLGKTAKYSHGANSSFGIPFDILGLKRLTYSPLEWTRLFLLAPISAWRKPYAEKIYIVEADCDRPREGQFLSSLLRPEVVVWLSSARTHSQNFEKSVRAGKFASVDEAISHEFGYFTGCASSLVIMNADNPLIMKQMRRTKAKVHEVKETELEGYEVRNDGTVFKIRGATYRIPFLLPKETFYAIAASVKIAEYLGIRPTIDFSAFTLPPGRSSIFRGIRDTTIIDGSYNTNADSVRVIIGMSEGLPGTSKWLILGDLTEQGGLEKEEHEKLARLLQGSGFQKLILVGPRLAAHTLPLLKQSKDVISFINPKDALQYLQSSLNGRETLVFKGARFLEGIIEHLLLDKRDVAKLCRREAVWQKRRAQWGL
ncbi:MAG: Mur ligase family protein [bacterium]|nr:Mur ligase family protein [bacterium]